MNLSNILVMCAPNGSMPNDTHQSLQKLQAARAVIQDGGAQTDVTLTRCIQAATALKVLKDKPEIEWIFWLDHDMVCEPSAIESLVEWSILLDYPSLSGVYVNRHNRQPGVAAYKLHNQSVINLQGRKFIPALTGMGCFLQHRDTFIAHCNESKQFHYPIYGNILPAVCESRLATWIEYASYLNMYEDKTALYWIAEDFSYTLREIKAGRKVFVAPVAFGHVASTILWPDKNTVFPGLVNGENSEL